MRRFVPFFVLISLVFIHGCQRRASEEAGKVVVSIACYYSPTNVLCQILDKSLDNFMRKNPEIVVKKIWLSRDYTNKILTMIAGGTPPDIFRTSPDMVITYILKGTLMPLDEFIEKSRVLKMEDFFPAVLYKYRFDGKNIGKGPLYGFGTDWSPDQTLFLVLLQKV